MVTVLFAGDLCPIGRVEQMVLDGRAGEVFGDLLPLLGRKDLSVANLECPLSARGRPIAKSGPNLRARPETIAALRAGGFDVACMANNHIADYGPVALADTIKLLRSRGIRHVGAGRSLGDACRPLRITRHGVRIAFLAFAENEFTCADDRTAGAWPLDPLNNLRQIRRARRSADRVIVLVHGGNEYNPFPSPRMVCTCRAFAEAGADAVVAGHTHCPQGWERHRGVPILYSLGNFLFDYPDDDLNPLWFTGLLARLTFARGPARVEIVPFRADRDDPRPRPMEARRRRRFRAYLRCLSRPLKDPAELQRYWDAWCAMKGPAWRHYLDRSDPADRRGFLKARNALSCEAHHELLCRYMELVRKRRLTEARRYVGRVRRLQRGLPPEPAAHRR